jgi:hypothetical protein
MAYISKQIGSLNALIATPTGIDLSSAGISFFDYGAGTPNVSISTPWSWWAYNMFNTFNSGSSFSTGASTENYFGDRSDGSGVQQNVINATNSSLGNKHLQANKMKSLTNAFGARYGDNGAAGAGGQVASSQTDCTMGQRIKSDSSQGIGNTFHYSPFSGFYTVSRHIEFQMVASGIPRSIGGTHLTY